MASQVSLLPSKIAIGAGTYTDIVSISAPSSATQGERVPVTVKVKNIDDYWDHLIRLITVFYDIYGEMQSFISETVIISSLEVHSFSGSFIMPSKATVIEAFTYYPYYKEWIFDDRAQRDVNLKEVVGWQLLDSRTIPVKCRLPPVVGWQLLDSRTAIVKFVPPVVGWQLLDSKTVIVQSVPPVVGWQLLDERTMPVKSGPPPVIGWQLLDEKLASLAAGPPEEIPPEYVPIQDTIYPLAYIYEGDAETCIFEFPLGPEQIPFMQWGGIKIAEAMASHVEEQGSRVLELKIYEDTTPALWTNYRVEVTAAVTPQGEGIAVWPVLAALPWVAIIKGALIVIGIIIVGWVIEKLIKAVDRAFFHPVPGLEEVKPAWSKETLIKTINDCEDHLERPLTPPETLEEMSDEELRDYLDELGKEVAPPEEISPGVLLALVGGLGILGVGAAAALAAAKPKE